MNVTPYLFYEGTCEAAIAFYEAALGAKVTMKIPYRDAPPSSGPSRLPDGSDDKIMHATLVFGTTELNMSDGMCQGNGVFEGFSLSLRVPDVATAERQFAALAEGGEVRQPLAETFFAPRFGMVADKFGVGWIVLVQS